MKKNRILVLVTLKPDSLPWFFSSRSPPPPRTKMKNGMLLMTILHYWKTSDGAKHEIRAPNHNQQACIAFLEQRDISHFVPSEAVCLSRDFRAFLITIQAKLPPVPRKLAGQDLRCSPRTTGFQALADLLDFALAASDSKL